MSNAEVRGKFVWHELATTDTAGAAAFYPKVITWKTQPWEQDASYTLLMAGNGPTGGVMALGDDAGATPHWITYIGTPDVAATVEAAKKLGATVLKDTSGVATGGKYAVLKDPQGATFAAYTPAPGTPSKSGAPGVGEFSWHELATTDFGAAMRFYQELFGWEKGRVHDMGGGMTYQLFNHGGQEVGGIFNGDSMGMAPGWTCYVRVDDAGKAANAAKSAGGRVVNGPMEVPGGDWVAQVMDPQGATFAVHERKVAAQPAAKPAAAKPAQAPKPAAQPAPAQAAKPAVKLTKPANSLPDRPAAPKPAAAKPAPAAAKPAAAAPAKPAAAKPAAKPAAKKAAKKAPAKKKGKKAAKKVVKKAAKRPAAKKAKKSAAKKAKKSGGKKVAKKAKKKARKHR